MPPYSAAPEDFVADGASGELVSRDAEVDSDSVLPSSDEDDEFVVIVDKVGAKVGCCTGAAVGRGTTMSGRASVGKYVGGVVVANAVGKAVGAIVVGDTVVGDGEGGSTGDNDGATVGLMLTSSVRRTTCTESIDGMVRINASVTIVGVNASSIIRSNNCVSVGICPVDDSTST